MHRSGGKQFKISLIGDPFVGKTSIRRSYLGKVFKTSYIPTIGVDFARKSVMVDETPVHLVIWDIAGQPLYENLRKRYYEGCKGLIVVYSVVNQDSFDHIEDWLVQAQGFMGKLPPLLIIGNKTDLRLDRSSGEVVSTQEGQDFSRIIRERLRTKTLFIETSALTGHNIDEAFKALVGMMLEQAGQGSQDAKKPSFDL